MSAHKLEGDEFPAGGSHEVEGAIRGYEGYCSVIVKTG